MSVEKRRIFWDFFFICEINLSLPPSIEVVERIIHFFTYLYKHESQSHIIRFTKCLYQNAKRFQSNYIGLSKPTSLLWKHNLMYSKCMLKQHFVMRLYHYFFKTTSNLQLILSFFVNNISNNIAISWGYKLLDANVQ